MAEITFHYRSRELLEVLGKIPRATQPKPKKYRVLLVRGVPTVDLEDEIEEVEGSSGERKLLDSAIELDD